MDSSSCPQTSYEQLSTKILWTFMTSYDHITVNSKTLDQVGFTSSQARLVHIITRLLFGQGRKKHCPVFLSTPPSTHIPLSTFVVFPLSKLSFVQLCLCTVVRSSDVIVMFVKDRILNLFL